MTREPNAPPSTDGPSAATDDVPCPFMGPAPFLERDAGKFFGRDKETSALLDRLKTQDLTILTAPSGVGKTSLIQAGLIPAMRLIRQKRTYTLGPVLCMQDWGAFKRQMPAQSMAQAIASEITRLDKSCCDKTNPRLLGQDCLCRDLKLLGNVPVPVVPSLDGEPQSEEERERLIKYLGDLCDAVPDRQLILIVDQAEELMGSGSAAPTGDQGDRAVHLLVAALREENKRHSSERKRMRVLLSLRQEYAGSVLRGLDLFYPHLQKRTHYLDPMTVGAFRTVAGLTMPELTREAIDRVLEWSTGQDGLKDDLSIDALVAQTILQDVWHEHPKSRSRAQFTIDRQYLDEYERQLQAEVTERCMRTGISTIVIDGAMRRAIERAIGQGAPGEHPGLRPGLIKRAAARMGGILASPRGFKRHVTDRQLVRESMREDLRTPALSDLDPDDHADILRSRRCGRSAEDELAPLPRVKNDSSDAEKAKAKADRIARAAFTAVRRLENGQILKRHRTSEDNAEVYALRHDGFGEPMYTWSESAQDQIEDALSSEVGCFGIAIKSHRKQADLAEQGLVWNGCHVKGVTFLDSRFTDCEFRGSEFKECHFSNCIFENCVLDATLLARCTVHSSSFIGCHLRSTAVIGGTWDGIARLRGCDASGMLIRGCKWSGRIEFVEKSILTSAIMELLELTGDVKIDDCTLHYAQVILQEGGRDHMSIARSDLHGALVVGYNEMSKTQKHDNRNDRATHVWNAPAEGVE